MSIVDRMGSRGAKSRRLRAGVATALGIGALMATVASPAFANHYYLDNTNYEDAAKWAKATLKENRCDEAAHRQLIQIYAAQGRRSAALQQYQRCERVLREELEVQPLPETVRLLQALLANELLPGHDIVKT